MPRSGSDIVNQLKTQNRGGVIFNKDFKNDINNNCMVYIINKVYTLRRMNR